MNHYGEKEAKFTTGGRGPEMSLGFHVSDVQKPLAAIWRIEDKGNLVQFGPNSEDNFIQNVTTKRKIPMIKNGGSYVIEDDFVAEELGFARQVVTTMRSLKSKSWPQDPKRKVRTRKEARLKWGPMLSGCARRRRTGI